MFRTLTLLTLLYLFIFHFDVLSQSSIEVPESYSQYYNNYLLLNPANRDTIYKVNFTLGNRSDNGLFKGISNSLLDIDLRIAFNQGRYHHLGIQVSNNREGEFIGKNRIYLRYGWRTNIGRKSSLSAGAALGLISYNFNSSVAGASGSSNATDGNIGLWYQLGTFSAGLSVQQIFNNEIRPINQLFYLKQYVNAILIKTLMLSPSVVLEGNVYYKFIRAKNQFFSLGAIATIQEKFQGGVVYRVNNDIAFTGGIKNIRVISAYISLSISYLSRLQNTTGIHDNTLEGMFGVRF